MPFKFPPINSLLHNELRLKIMVALDNLESADFVFLYNVTDASRGNLSVQIRTLQDAGYLEVTKTGFGRLSHTVCRITKKGKEALANYENALRQLFSHDAKKQDTPHENTSPHDTNQADAG